MKILFYCGVNNNLFDLTIYLSYNHYQARQLIEISLVCFTDGFVVLCFAVVILSLAFDVLDFSEEHDKMIYIIQFYTDFSSICINTFPSHSLLCLYLYLSIYLT